MIDFTHWLTFAEDLAANGYTSGFLGDLDDDQVQALLHAAAGMLGAARREEMGRQLRAAPAEAAEPTPGPWEIGEITDISPDDQVSEWRVAILHEGHEIAAAYNPHYEQALADARFICDARSPLP